MEIPEEQYQQVAPLFPVAPGRGKRLTRKFQCRPLSVRARRPGAGRPERFGPWHTVYMRRQHWNEQGTLTRVFAELRARAARGSVGGVGLEQRQRQGASRCYGGAEKGGSQSLVQSHDGVGGRKLRTLRGAAAGSGLREERHPPVGPRSGLLAGSATAPPPQGQGGTPQRSCTGGATRWSGCSAG